MYVDTLRSCIAKRRKVISKLHESFDAYKDSMVNADNRMNYAVAMVNLEKTRDSIREEVKLQKERLSEIRKVFEQNRNTADWKASDIYRKQRSAERKAKWEANQTVVVA